MPDQSHSFYECFHEELKWIKKRRQALRRVDCLPANDSEPDDNLPDKSLENQQTDHCQDLARLEQQALNADLCGLAISGGGIRSATFGLGILQGLAMTGLLPRFDYLSTVSGGGYIGSWLSAWINRDGFASVEKQLLPPRLQPPATTLGTDEQSKAASTIEARPIQHLRLYSNYLAPRPGLFSFDGWVLIAIFLRNLLLNQLLLLLAVLALFAGVRMLVEFHSIAYGAEFGDRLWGGFLVAPVAVLLIPIFGLWMHAPAIDSPVSPTGESRTALRRWLSGMKSMPFDLRWYWGTCVIPWIVGAFLASLLFSAKSSQGWSSEWPLALAVILFMGGLHMMIGWFAFSCRLRGSVMGLVTGTAAGIALVLSWSALLSCCRTSTTDLTVAIVAVSGVPICLIIFVLTNFMMVGLCGWRLSELERERWSSLNSRFMFIAAAWLCLFSAAVFGPWLLVSAWHVLFHSNDFWLKLATGTMGTGWIGILLGGLKAAAGHDTGSGRKSSFKESLAQIAPILFLASIFLGCALCTTWIAYDIHAFASIKIPNLNRGADESWYFVNRPNRSMLLTDLNAPTLANAAWSQFPFGWLALAIGSLGLFGLAEALGWYVGVNTFSLQNLYANRLVRCYLGASKQQRNPDPVVNMDLHDDVEFSTLFPGQDFQRHQLDIDLGNPKADALRKVFDAKTARTQSERTLSGTSAEESGFWGPIHIVNGALNQKAASNRNGRNNASSNGHDGGRQAENLQFLERQAESFVFTPLFCGSETTGYCRSYEFAGDVKLGTAVAVSGAAVSPNMGYHSSPSITALLTVFNVRLGAWFGNPQTPKRGVSNPAASSKLLLSELAGLTDANSEHIYVSDGGHFENMGVYELIRRRCRFIVAVDAGADPKFHENVGRLVRQIRIDFGIWVEVDLSTATPGPNGLCKSHVVVGRIHYGDVNVPDTKVQRSPSDPKFSYDHNDGIIVWFKNSLTGDEPGDLVNQAAMHPTFPYDSTIDQFFSESQFESYRALGVHSILKSMVFPADQIMKCSNHNSAAEPQTSKMTMRWNPTMRQVPTRQVFEAVYNHWLQTPTEFVATYVNGNDGYSRIQASLRSDRNLARLATELYGTDEDLKSLPPSTPAERTAERLMANEMLTLLENVFLSLDLEHHFLHPVHEGWMNVFKHWCNSPTVKAAWLGKNAVAPLSDEYSPSFKRFIGIVQDSKGKSP